MKIGTYWFLFAACAVLACQMPVGCSRASEQKRESDPKREPSVQVTRRPAGEYVYEPVRAASVYVTLVEKPDAARVLLLGDGAKALTNYFTHAGAEAFVKSDGGRYDALVIDCGEMTKASCAKACSLVKDDGVVTWLMDVKDMPMARFKSLLQAFDLPEVHLWMPGSDRWLLTGHKTACQVSLSSQLELFARESIQDDLVAAKCANLADVYASYVGTREDVMPAFEGAKEDVPVRPAFFLSKKIGPIGWLVAGDDVDEDIRKSVFADVHDRQVVRRLVVGGDLMSERVRDRKGEKTVTGQWAKANLRNPNDLMLLERLDRLGRNARGFLEVNKVLQAMKCYETMVIVRPNDAAAVHNFGMCLKRVGKIDMAEKILERARTLSDRR